MTKINKKDDSYVTAEEEASGSSATHRQWVLAAQGYGYPLCQITNWQIIFKHWG